MRSPCCGKVVLLEYYGRFWVLIAFNQIHYFIKGYGVRGTRVGQAFYHNESWDLTCCQPDHFLPLVPLNIVSLKKEHMYSVYWAHSSMLAL